MKPGGENLKGDISTQAQAVCVFHCIERGHTVVDVTLWKLNMIFLSRRSKALEFGDFL